MEAFRVLSPLIHVQIPDCPKHFPAEKIITKSSSFFIIIKRNDLSKIKRFFYGLLKMDAMK